MADYEVQGRRAQYDARPNDRNNVRLIKTTSSASALIEARKLANDGFTVWVFETQQALTVKKYRLLQTVHPQSGT